MKILITISILLGSLLAGNKAPDESELTGTWGYSGNRFIFMESEGTLPSSKEVDAHLSAMGASHENLELTFSDDHKCTLRLGEKSFDVNWSLDSSTAEFKTAVGLFNLKGYLVQDGDRILLVYSRPNLFMIMKFLCTSAGRKHMTPLGSLLDCCKGLTIGMEFSR